MVPEARPRSYHGHRVVSPPPWKDYISWYLFTGGLAGASLTLAAGARRSGDDLLARRALVAAAAGFAASPPLLIADLGRPRRFLAMLRVAKPSSPMSVGTWLMTAAGGCAAGAVAGELAPPLRGAGRVAEAAGGVLGTAVATYTAVLLADTAVPLWREARVELPLLFAASAAASAGAAATVLTPPRHAAPARRLAVGGVVAEVVASTLMERRLADLAAPLRSGDAGRLARAARGAGLGGAALVALGGRARPVAALGGALVLGSTACQRFAIFRAGLASAADPVYTVAPQRDRLTQRPAQASRSTRSAPL